jgi:hypothetical protein
MFWRKINKDLLRNILYGISVIFILYFLYTINSTSQEITEKELYLEQNKGNSFNDLFNLNNEIKEFKTYGEYIWIICLSLLQIIFLVMFMLMLYQNE